MSPVLKKNVALPESFHLIQVCWHMCFILSFDSLMFTLFVLVCSAQLQQQTTHSLFVN